MSKSSRPLIPADRPLLHPAPARAAAGISGQAAILAAQAEPEPDPLAGIPEGLSLEEEVVAEQEAIQSAFKARAKRENERFRLVTDSEFWVAVCFQSREQKEAFLAGMGWDDLGDKYLDGTQIAARHKIKLPKVDLRGIRRKIDKSWRQFVKL